MAPQAIALDLSNFYIVAAVLGGFLSVFGLVSYLLKEQFYLSEALISTVVGLIFSTHAAGLIRPLEYTYNNQASLNLATHYFCHLVLGVQLVRLQLQAEHPVVVTERNPVSGSRRHPTSEQVS